MRYGVGWPVRELNLWPLPHRFVKRIFPVACSCRMIEQSDTKMIDQMYAVRKKEYCRQEQVEPGKESQQDNGRRFVVLERKCDAQLGQEKCQQYQCAWQAKAKTKQQCDGE